MSRGTAYYDLPNGERIELPTTMPDVEEVPGPLCDGKFELPEAVKEMFKWMDETFGTWESDFSSFKIWMKLRKNFNPPVRWEAMQDKRRNPKPLGRNTYLYKARKIKSLARSTHTRVSLHKGKQKGTEEQCKHTFKITAARCAPCSGYNVECEHYEKNSAADTKHDLYIGTKTAIFPLTGFPKAQNESELATLLGISKKEWADIEFDNDCPDDLHHIEGMLSNFFMISFSFRIMQTGGCIPAVFHRSPSSGQ